MNEIKGVRIHWDYRIESLNNQELYVSGKVTLVGIDRDNRQVMRKLPPLLKDALIKL
jgi:acyl-CoA thioester hydrolase